jgi:hypothetical protein
MQQNLDTIDLRGKIFIPSHRLKPSVAVCAGMLWGEYPENISAL